MMMKKTVEFLMMFVFIAVLCQPCLAQEKPRAEIVSVDIPKDIIVGQPAYVDVVVKNTGGDARSGGISISFPDNPLVSIVYSDTTKATVYPPGSQIWSNIEKKSISSKYVLLEAWQEPWESQDECRFKLKVMPNLVGKLRVYVRATVTVPAKRREIIKTPNTSMITDQQGFPVLSYEVEVIDQAATSMKVTINKIDVSYYLDVICYVVVTDEVDRPLSDLTKENFSVSEDGVIQNVNVVYESKPVLSVSSIVLDNRNQLLPISVALAIDSSESMNEKDKMTTAISAAITFIDLMLPADKALIVGFSDYVNVYGSSSSSKLYLRSLVKNLTPGGRTELYDAVAISIDEVVKESGQKAVIALTDGVENQNNTKYQKIEKIKRSGIPVYMIGLGNTINEYVMRQIAWDTGGRYYHVPITSPLRESVFPYYADLANLYGSISQQLHQIYVVKYTTKALLRGGTVHNVMVKVQHQGMSGQDIRGYSGIVRMQ